MRTITKRFCFAFALVSLLTLAVVRPANATSLVNGDFETGTLAGWTTFTTTNGTLGTGFPNVVLFDTNNDTNLSLAAQFRVGRVPGSGNEGGGILQTVILFGGSLSISADIAMLVNAGAGNAAGGLFELLLDNVVVDSFDFGFAPLGVTEHSMLADVGVVSVGAHSIGIRMRRPFVQNSLTPVQYIDNFAISGPATTAPEFSGKLYGMPNFGWIFSLGGGLLGLTVIRRRHSR